MVQYHIKQYHIDYYHNQSKLMINTVVIPSLIMKTSLTVSICTNNKVIYVIVFYF